jgi:hypothetical protein
MIFRAGAKEIPTALSIGKIPDIGRNHFKSEIIIPSVSNRGNP